MSWETAAPIALSFFASFTASFTAFKIHIFYIQQHLTRHETYHASHFENFDKLGVGYQPVKRK